MTSLPIYVPGDPVVDPSSPESTFRWATVTDNDPLRVRFDGDPEGLPVTPSSLVASSSLAIGDRVWVQLFGRRLIVLGKGGGSGGGGGLLGLVTNTSASSTTTSTSGVYVDPYRITFDAVPGHLYRINWDGRVRSTVSGDDVTATIREGGVTFGGDHYIDITSSSNAYSFHAVAYIRGVTVAEERTVEGWVERASGTGSVSIHASSTSIAYFTVEDLGLEPA